MGFEPTSLEEGCNSISTPQTTRPSWTSVSPLIRLHINNSFAFFCYLSVTHVPALHYVLFSHSYTPTERISCCVSLYHSPFRCTHERVVRADKYILFINHIYSTYFVRCYLRQIYCSVGSCRMFRHCIYL